MTEFYFIFMFNLSWCFSNTAEYIIHSCDTIIYVFFPEARVVMTATQEEITGTIMTTEMRYVHLM